MNHRSRCVALALLNALLLPLDGALAAQTAVDPAVGSWTLNLAKSTLDPSEAGLKSAVRTYTATADGMTTSVHSVDASGVPQDTGTTFVYDGKRHPSPTDAIRCGGGDPHQHLQSQNRAVPRRQDGRTSSARRIEGRQEHDDQV